MRQADVLGFPSQCSRKAVAGPVNSVAENAVTEFHLEQLSRPSSKTTWLKAKSHCGHGNVILPPPLSPHRQVREVHQIRNRGGINTAEQHLILPLPDPAMQCRKR
eukprot:scaffold23647_cov17-Tisochrysis_lutea.AAC.1